MKEHYGRADFTRPCQWQIAVPEAEVFIFINCASPVGQIVIRYFPVSILYHALIFELLLIRALSPSCGVYSIKTDPWYVNHFFLFFQVNNSFDLKPML